jgi:hypothetical protein
MSTILEIAKKCEHADGPSRDLDVSIAYALHPDIGNYQPHCPGEEPIFWNDPYRKQPCPKFTASFDAAASLIPEGHDWIIEHVNGGMTIGARVGHNDPDKTSWGNTAVLALCAAALKAHAALAHALHHQASGEQ